MKKNVFIAITLMLFSYSGIASYASPITGQSTLSVSEDDNSGNLDSLSVEQLRDSLNSLIRYANAILITGKREKEYYGELPLYEECEKTLTTSMEKAWELVNTDSKDKEAIIAAINDLTDKSSDAKQIVHEYDTYFLNSEYEVTHLYNELDEDGKAAFRKMMGVRILKDTSPCHHPDITTWKRYYLKTFVDSVYMMAIRQQSTYGVDMTEGIKYHKCDSGYKEGQFSANELHLAKVKDWTVLRIADDTTVVDMPENFHVNTSLLADGDNEAKQLMSPLFTEWVNTAENPDFLRNNHVIIKHDTETGFRPGRYKMEIRTAISDFKSSSEKAEGFKFLANGAENIVASGVHANSSEVATIEFHVGEDGIMDYAFEFDHTDFNTFMFSYMRLTYYGKTFSYYEVRNLIYDANHYIGKGMHKDVQDSLKTAKEALEKDHSYDNASALKKAIVAAEKSAKLYKDAEEIIDVCDSIICANIEIWPINVLYSFIDRKNEFDEKRRKRIFTEDDMPALQDLYKDIDDYKNGITNAVENVIAQKDAPSEIYSLNGIRQTTVKKGISIIRNADGSVTKRIK